MAQQIITSMIDDIDGKSVAAETVAFGLDGNEYEIDLTAKRAGELRAVLARHAEHARKVGRKAPGVRTRADRKARPIDTGAVRAWAKANGYDIKDRGRVPADLAAKYQAASAANAAMQGG